MDQVTPLDSHNNASLGTLALRDLSGQLVVPFSPTNAGVSAFLFVAPDCPISNRYAPEMARLHEKYGGRVKFWIVYPGTNATPRELSDHFREYQLPGGGLRDLELRLTRAAQVRLTPEVAVFTKERGLVYHGRIDDQFADFGVKRARPARRDLEEALEAVLTGKPVPTPATSAIGCPIPGVD